MAINDTPKRRVSGGPSAEAVRAARARTKKRKAGLRAVLVWVPDGDQDAIRAAAAALRTKAGYDD